MPTLGRRSVFALTSRTTTCLQACCTRAPTDVTSTPRSLVAHLDEACVVPHRGQVQRPPPLPPRSSRHAAPPEGPMRLSERGTAGVEHGREGSKRGEGYGVERGRGKGKGHGGVGGVDRRLGAGGQQLLDDRQAPGHGRVLHPPAHRGLSRATTRVG